MDSAEQLSFLSQDTDELPDLSVIQSQNRSFKRVLSNPDEANQVAVKKSSCHNQTPEMDTSTNISANKPRTNLYDLGITRSSPGPFIVYLEHSDKNIGRLHPMGLGRKLSKAGVVDFLEFSSVSPNRVKVSMKTPSSANKLVNNKLLADLGLRAYIPNFLVQKQGVVRDVDVTLSEELIREFIVSPVPVLEVRRMKKKLDNGTLKALPLIVVTFAGINLPTHITIDHVRCSVEESKRPLAQCNNCLRFGHRSSNCKSKARCNLCAAEHATAECEFNTSNTAGYNTQNLPYVCVHCQGPHQATDKKCPHREKQIKTWELMNKNNISFAEAAKQLKAEVKPPSPSSCASQNVDISTASQFSGPEHSYSQAVRSGLSQSKRTQSQYRSPSPSQELLYTPDLNQASTSQEPGTFPQYDPSIADAICALLKQLLNMSGISNPWLDKILQFIVSFLPTLKSFFSTTNTVNGP